MHNLNLFKVETAKIFDRLSKEEETFLKDNFQTEPDSDFIFIDEEALNKVTKEILSGRLTTSKKLYDLLNELIAKEKEGFIHVVMEY
ncbi:hypothetical protein KAR91_81530 [Candidatus Pacearchaeota archaeon]|nr:hypothetical protein [Candidatus Pacearchaeota archaeon]